MKTSWFLQRGKLKIDLTKPTASAALGAGQPGWKPPSRERQGCAGAQFLQIYLSHRPHGPNTSKKSCLWNALHFGAGGSHRITAPRQTGFRESLWKGIPAANPSPGRGARGQWKKLPIEGAKLDWHSNRLTVKENGKENLQVNERIHGDK